MKIHYSAHVERTAELGNNVDVGPGKNPKLMLRDFSASVSLGKDQVPKGEGLGAPVDADQLEDQAINEMQHLGWLAEEIVSGDASPRIEHTKPDQSTETADMLRADIKIEKEVAAAYDQAAKEVTDPGLKKLLLRIRDHEIYHTEVFTDLLKEEEEK